jgi:hypothetical protein
MSPFDINSAVFHFVDINYEDGSQPYFFNNYNSAVFFIIYNKMKQYIDELKQLTKVICWYEQYKTGALKRKREVKQSENILK